MKSIAKELENRKVLICPICNENPVREGLKTCSKECNKIRTKVYMKCEGKTDKRKAYLKAYYQRPEVKASQKVLHKTDKYRAYQKEYKKRPEVKAYQKARTKARWELVKRHKVEFNKIKERLLKENEKTNTRTNRRN